MFGIYCGVAARCSFVYAEFYNDRAASVGIVTLATAVPDPDFSVRAQASEFYGLKMARFVRVR
jgi:hypothetical protein